MILNLEKYTYLSVMGCRHTCMRWHAYACICKKRFPNSENEQRAYACGSPLWLHAPPTRRSAPVRSAYCWLTLYCCENSAPQTAVCLLRRKLYDDAQFHRPRLCTCVSRSNRHSHYFYANCHVSMTNWRIDCAGCAAIEYGRHGCTGRMRRAGLPESNLSKH